MKVFNFFSFLLFFLGLAIGSFSNVVIYRLNHKQPGKKTGIFGGRSFCPKCKKKIFWYDNIPLLSFLLLKGKCRSCQTSISWQYPLVELSAGVLFVLVYHQWLLLPSQNLSSLFFQLFLTSILTIIFVSDWLYFIIPDEVVFLGIGVSFFWRLGENPSLGEYLLTGLGAAVAFLFLVLVTRGKGMGGGDVKLAALMGLVLGWPGILVALYLAFLTGAFLGVILIMVGKKHFGEQIPFGPFLVLATIISMFWGDKIWQAVSGVLL